MSEPPYLVVGLGNPGPTYTGHRHNVGFMVVDLIADRLRERFKAHRGRADVVDARFGSQRVILMKPKSFMNESGGPVTSLRDYFKVPTERIVVVHDELDLPFATLRIKQGGGDNGHNGLRSMRKSLGTGEFLRVRFGIGRPPGSRDPADFVLSEFSTTERKELPFHVDRAADATEALVTDGLVAAQNVYNAAPER